jgi:hypothetical protein
MSTIDRNLTTLETEFINKKNSNGLSESEERSYFQTFNAYFRLICSITLKNIRDNARNSMKIFLKKGINLESVFASTNSTYSLKPKLLQFINKLSNSQVVEYIRELIDSYPKTETEFAIIFDFIRHPSSSSLRERLCREEVLLSKSFVDYSRAGAENEPKVFCWSLILRETCKACPYFLHESSKFRPVFDRFWSIFGNKNNLLSNISFLDTQEVFVKVLQYYVCANKKELDIREVYLINFLEEKCYDFGGRIEPFLSQFNTVADLRSYLDFVKRLARDVFHRPREQISKAESNPDLVRFLISKVTVPILNRVGHDAMNPMIEFLSSLANSRSNSAGTNPNWADELAHLLQLVLVVLVRYQFNATEAPYKDFLMSYLRICWDQISNNNELNQQVLNYSKLIISIMNAKYSIFKMLQQPDRASQLYDFLIIQNVDEAQDDDTPAIWLESIRNLIPICKEQNKEWRKSFLGITDTTRRGSPQINPPQSRFWKAFIYCREHFGQHLLQDFGDRFFGERFSTDNTIHSNQVFDLLLIILVHVIVNDRVEAARNSIFLPQNRQNILERLINLLKTDQESSKNLNDKFYGLLMLYLKFFAHYGMEVTLTPELLDQLTSSYNVDENKQEQVNTINRYFKAQTSFATLITYLMRRESSHTRSILGPKLVTYISRNQIFQTPNAFLARTQLFPVLYNLIRLAIEVDPGYEEIKNLAYTFFKKCQENKIYSGIYFGLLAYHLILDKGVRTTEIRVADFDMVFQRIIANLYKKNNKQRSFALSFDEIFKIDSTARLPEMSIQVYYKFFLLVMLRLLAYVFKTSRSDKDFGLFAEAVEAAIKKPHNPEYDLKYQTFLLIKSFIVPEAPNIQEDRSLKALAIQDLPFHQQKRLLQAAFIDSTFCLKESTNENFKVLFNEYYSIVLAFVKRFSNAEEMPTFFRQYVQPNFMLLEGKLKTDFVFTIEHIVGVSLFDRLEFFFRNQESVVAANKMTPNDNYEAFSAIMIHYLHSAQTPFRVDLIINGFRCDCNKELLSAFVSLLEIEGAESAWSCKFVKSMLVAEFQALDIPRRQSFIINFINFLIERRNLSPFELNTYLELLFTLSPASVQSEVFVGLGTFGGRVMALLNQYETLDAVTVQGPSKITVVDRLKQVRAAYYRLLSVLIR